MGARRDLWVLGGDAGVGGFCRDGTSVGAEAAKSAAGQSCLLCERFPGFADFATDRAIPTHSGYSGTAGSAGLLGAGVGVRGRAWAQVRPVVWGRRVQTQGRAGSFHSPLIELQAWEQSADTCHRLAARMPATQLLSLLLFLWGGGTLNRGNPETLGLPGSPASSNNSSGPSDPQAKPSRVVSAWANAFPLQRICPLGCGSLKTIKPGV